MFDPREKIDRRFKQPHTIRRIKGKNWAAVNQCLVEGLRGLPGGSTLPMLLAAKRDLPNYWTRLRLTIEKILAWADAVHERTGQWPRIKAVPIPEAPGETWYAVDAALRKGGRGLPGGSSLPLLFASKRGARNNYSAPKLTRKRILAWADAHQRRTGTWPNRDSGAIAEAPGDTWAALDAALHQDSRGLYFAGCSCWPSVGTSAAWRTGRADRENARRGAQQ